MTRSGVNTEGGSPKGPDTCKKSPSRTGSLHFVFIFSGHERDLVGDEDRVDGIGIGSVNS